MIALLKRVLAGSALVVLVSMCAVPFVHAQTPETGKEICDNNTDDNGDKLVDGADPQCYTLLAPLPGLTSVNTTEGLAPYLNTIYTLAIGLAGVAGVVLIVIYGIEYMVSESITGKSDALKRVGSSVFGLILLIGSVVLLNTINPNLTIIGINIPTVTHTLEEDLPDTVTNGNKICNGKYTLGSDWGAASGLPIATYSDGSAIPTNHAGDCAKVGDHGCTSLRGLNPKVLDILKVKCPTCEILVTGGTECWEHKTHGPNLTSIDLRATPAPILNEYITGTTTTFPNNGMTYTKDGIRFLAEKAGQTVNTTGPHWHASAQ